MATAGTVRTHLGRRLRDTAFTAHPSALVLRLIDNVQKTLNAALGIKRSTVAAFAVPAKRLLFLNTEVAADIARIDSIRHEGAALIEVDWHSLQHGDPEWYRREGPAPTAWARIGGDMFVLYPAPKYATTVEVTYTRVTTAVSADGTTMDLPDEYLPLVEDFAECILSMKTGKFAQIEDPLQRFTDAVSALRGEKIANTEKPGG